MNPKKVQEMLNGLIDELNLPINILDSGPIVIIGPGDMTTRRRAEEIVKEWINGSHGISVGRTVAEKDKLTERSSLDTHRSSEVKSILESLIAEEGLPLTVTHNSFHLAILIDEGVDYRSEDMVMLESIFEKEGLDVLVRHNGFCLRHREDNRELQFSDAVKLANHLASLLIEHGLHVKLLHKGFTLHKSKEDEIDIAEAKELTNRLENMVGIRYVQGSYGYIVSGQNEKVHWTHAGIYTA